MERKACSVSQVARQEKKKKDKKKKKKELTSLK